MHIPHEVVFTFLWSPVTFQQVNVSLASSDTADQVLTFVCMDPAGVARNLCRGLKCWAIVYNTTGRIG